jgi:protein-disulfide isomerase
MENPMNSNRVLIGLVALTLVMQGGLLYKQYSQPARSSGLKAAVRKAPEGSALDLGGLPIQGSPDARVVLVEFSDYECPFCSRHASSVANDLDQKFIASGKVRHAFMQNPLSNHANARPLAAAAICAGRQNLFWEMHRKLFSIKARTKEQIMTAANDLPLDTVQFSKCLENSADLNREIDEHIEQGRKLGVSGTPSFALGHVDGQGRMTVESIIAGAQPLSVFEATIAELLSK